MKNFFASLAPEIFDILRPLFLASLTWAVVKLVAYINAHTKTLQTQAVLLRLNDAVATAVESVEQTMVAKLRDDAGKLGAASVDVKSAAVEQIKSNLGTAGLSGTMVVLGIESSKVMDDVLGAKVEAHVLKLPERKTWPERLGTS